MNFFLKKGRLMVSGAAFISSNENTNVVAAVPSGQKIHAVIRQLLREVRKEHTRMRARYDIQLYAWNLAEEVSEKILPVGKCPLWYREFLTTRCYEAILRTSFFNVEKDPAMNYALKLTLKKSAKL